MSVFQNFDQILEQNFNDLPSPDVWWSILTICGFLIIPCLFTFALLCIKRKVKILFPFYIKLMKKYLATLSFVHIFNIILLSKFWWIGYKLIDRNSTRPYYTLTRYQYTMWQILICLNASEWGGTIYFAVFYFKVFTANHI